jgi:polysaccharide biosynthesis PFTS motif protein
MLDNNIRQNKYSKALSSSIFHELLEEIGNGLNSKSFTALGYSERLLVDRFLQKFYELEVHDFKRKYAGLDIDSIMGMKSIKFKRFVYCTNSNKLSINKVYLIVNLVRFFMQYFSVLFINIRAFLNFSSGIKSKKATLVYGISADSLFINGNDLEFIRFCVDGNIDPLKRAKSIIIECNNNLESLNSRRVEYREDPLYELLFRSRIEFIEFIQFLNNHVKSIIAYIKLLFFYRIFSVLHKDFSHHALVELLNNKHAIENIVITLSNYSEQFLWMSNLKDKNFHLHMAWYAICETYYHTFKWDKNRILSKQFEYIRVDESWVWTKDFSSYLKKIGVTGVFHHVGPILWHLPTKKPIQIPGIKKKSINICIFDKSPKNKAVIESFGESNLYQYFSCANMSKFINDIVDVVNGIEKYSNRKINLLLKHRMNDVGHDDEQYNSLITNLSEVEKRIFVVNPYVNFYSLVEKCDLIIVFPYSSPAYVADYIGVPAVYFDPIKNLIPIYERTKKISFASGRDELKIKLDKILL